MGFEGEGACQKTWLQGGGGQQKILGKKGGSPKKFFQVLQ